MEEEEYSYSDDTYFSSENENAEVAPSVTIETEQKSGLIQKLGPKISKVGSVIRITLKDQQAESVDTSERNQALDEKEEKVVDAEAVTSKPEKNFAPVTHVIFDLDGTLIDTETINNRIISSIAAEYDKEYTPEIRNRVMGRISREASITAVNLLGIPLTPEEFYARVEVENFRIMSEVNLMPGVERLIRHLYRNEVPMAVATSSSRTSYDIKSTLHKELFKYFNHIVTGGSDPEVIGGKPAPDVYLVCASRFPDKPKSHKCLAFEDSPNGVKAALNAGMQVVMIPDSSTKTELTEEATLVLQSLNDFRPELFALPEFESN